MSDLWEEVKEICAGVVRDEEAFRKAKKVGESVVEHLSECGDQEYGVVILGVTMALASLVDTIYIKGWNPPKAGGHKPGRLIVLRPVDEDKPQ